MNDAAVPPPDTAFAHAADLLQAHLAAAPAGEVLWIGPATRVAVQAPGRVVHALHEPASWQALPFERRFAVGVVVEALEVLPEAQAAALLARLRDQLCERVLVLTAPGSAWDRNRLLALEYTLRGRAAGPDGLWRLYAYDVDSYNPERSWNNSSDWAHPENYHRYRW